MPENTKQWYGLLDENSVVIQKQPYPQDGFIEIPDHVVAGYILQNGEFVAPPPEPKPAPDEDLLEIAQLFKTIMTIHFGEGAETNTNITERTVTQYFVNRRLTGTSDATDASDGILLQKGFEAINAYTGDGTVWSFPWELVP